MKGLSLAASLAAVLAAGGAHANEFWLCAKPTDVTMPNGTVVPMWGYAQVESAGFPANCAGAQATIPGPMLELPPGENSMTIHLANLLPAPTSIMLPAQPGGMTPTYLSAADGVAPELIGRVRSFTHEVPAWTDTAQDPPTGDYTWSGLRPGSYVYQSGTHLAVQVQMGLYGAMKKDFAAGMAYDGVPYDSEVTVFYSEVDPALHRAVADGRYGTGNFTSTIDYKPRFFLVNGMPWNNATPPLPGGMWSERLLVRFFNMGLDTHVAVINGLNMDVIAEDGRPYNHGAGRLRSNFRPASRRTSSWCRASRVNTRSTTARSTSASARAHAAGCSRGFR